MSLADLLYGGGELRAPSPEAALPEPLDPDELRAFVAEARLALRGEAQRSLVCVVGDDRPGLVASVARRLADLDINIEAANQMAAGGRAILSLTVSASARLDRTRSDLETELNRASAQWSAKTYVLSAVPVEEPIPRRDHLRWAARLTGPRNSHTSKLARLTAAAGGEGWPVVALDSIATLEQFELELTFATETNVSAKQAADVLRQVDGEIQLVPASNGRLDVSERLIRRSPDVSVPANGFLWVTGVAEPGLLANVFSVVNNSQSTVSVVSMAILEGHTVALIGVEIADHVDPSRLRREIERSSGQASLRVTQLEARQGVARARDENSDLVVVRAVTEEQKGVVAEISERIARVGGDICRIRSQVVGTSRPPDCDVEMAVWLSESAQRRLETDLKDAQDAFGWTTSYVAPFRTRAPAGR